MFGILPLLGLILLSLSAHASASKDRLFRESILVGFLLWGCIITGIMEILSIFHALNFQGVLTCWCFVMVACISIIWRQKKLDLPWRAVSGLSWTEKILLFAVFLIVVWLAVLAFLAPPNTIDAMTYHMSRVVHWIQNHTVEYYPTRILRELFSPPLNEYTIFQFQILSRTDLWANSVQWLSMMGSLIGVSLIAKELGAGSWGQILSVVITATIPMGILQSTSTQTDYGVTLWLCAFVYFLGRWRKDLGRGHALWMATALGLAFLAKGTGFVYAIPFLLWMLVIMATRLGAKSLAVLAGMVLIVGLLNGGVLCRNAKLFHGNMTMSVEGTSRYTGIDNLVNDHWGWQEFWANVLRNTGLELSTPWARANKVIEGDLYGASNLLHVDINDMPSSFNRAVFTFPSLSLYEDNAESPLHVILFIMAVLFVLIFPLVRDKEIVFYLLALFGAIIAFNLLLKWQPWGARFHLSFFVLAAPLIGAVFEKALLRGLALVVMAVLVAGALPYLLFNPSKSFVTLDNIIHHKDRHEEYFDPSVLAQYKNVRDGLKTIGCHDLGLLATEFVHEYPLWRVFNPANDGSMRIEHMLVNHVSSPLAPSVYPLGDFSPCAFISVSYNFPNPGLRLDQKPYIKVLSQGQGGNETDIFVQAGR